MSAFSSRHLPAVVALLAVAAVPVWLATLREGRWDDCAHPESLRDMLDALPGTPGASFQRFFRRHVFHREEGLLATGPGLHPMRTRIVRTDEARHPFDRPTRFLHAPMDPERILVREIPFDGAQVPVHLLYAGGSRQLRVVASLYVYDGRPVDSLLRLQLGSALEQLLSGRRPLTLFQVEGLAPTARRREIEEPAIAWVLSAWAAYQARCDVPGQAPGEGPRHTTAPGATYPRQAGRLAPQGDPLSGAAPEPDAT